MSIKIIDCFIFYNELELLKYRLNVLDEVVDYFVIVESTHTFIGKEKKLYYNENKDLFEKFKKKIIHIVVDNIPFKYPNININKGEQWQNEYFQRNCISQGLNLINNLELNDILIISDVDEIPNRYSLNKIKNDGENEKIKDICSLEMDLYYYNLNTKFLEKWYAAKILTYKKYKEVNMSINDIRQMRNNYILNGGWHLSYFGDCNFIKNKVENFSHQELNKDEYINESKIKERIENNRDLYGRNYYEIKKIEIKDNNNLPPEYEKYLSNYYTI